MLLLLTIPFAAPQNSSPDPIFQGLELLKASESSSNKNGMLQYQLENLIRSSASEISAAQFLDSLTARIQDPKLGSTELLENLCWVYKNYNCAFQNFSTQLQLKKISAPDLLERVGRFQAQGYFDHAFLLLANSQWRLFPTSSKSMARNYFFQLASQLKNWPAIDSELTVTSKLPDFQWTPEIKYISALALVKLGKAQSALQTLNELEKNAPTPWGYRSRILKAQAQIALGKSKEATQILTNLKHDPHRKEGTGPILFWQAWLAINQNQFVSAESLLVLACSYTGSEESQRALEYRFFLLQDTGKSREPFFAGLTESPKTKEERLKSLNSVTISSGLWPFAKLEKAQILVQMGQIDSAEAELNAVSLKSPDRIAGLEAEAKAAFLQEKFLGGKQAALVRYENLLIKYQQGVLSEFSRERIKALK